MKKEVKVNGKSINCIELDSQIREILISSGCPKEKITYVNFFEYGNELHVRIGYFNCETSRLMEEHFSAKDQFELLLDLKDYLDK